MNKEEIMKYTDKIIEIAKQVDELARELEMTVYFEGNLHEERNLYSTDAVFMKGEDGDISHIRFENIFSDWKFVPKRTWNEFKED